jgi:hypothetical protein
MEFKSEFSSLNLLEDKLKSESFNLFKTSRSIYTINYDRINDISITSYGIMKYLFFIIGIIIIIWGFDRGPEYTYGDIGNGSPKFYLFDYSKTQILQGLFWGGVFILGGILYNKKFGKYKALTLTIFEGKKKSIDIYTTDNTEELNIIKKEIEKHILK